MEIKKNRFRMSNSLLLIVILISAGAVSVGISYAFTNNSNPFTAPYKLMDSNGNVTRLTVDSTGKIGIGTTNPKNLLDVNGVMQTEGSRFIVNGFDATNYFWFRTNGTEPGSVFLGLLKNSTTGNPLKVFINPAGAGVSGLTVTNLGRVGIGTTIPSTMLHMNSTILNSPWLTLETSAAPNSATFGPAINFKRTGISNSIVIVEEPGYGDSLSFALAKTPFTRLANIQQSGNVGIGTTSPAAKLDVAGTVHLTGLSVNEVTKTATYTLGSTDDTVLGNSTGGAFTLTLPTASGIAGKIFDIKKIDSSAYAITIATTSSQTIDGGTTLVLSSQYDFVVVESDGKNWKVLAGNSFAGNVNVGGNLNSTASSGTFKITAKPGVAICIGTC